MMFRQQHKKVSRTLPIITHALRSSRCRVACFTYFFHMSKHIRPQSTSTMTTSVLEERVDKDPAAPNMWRSKLGSNYDKDWMQQNELLLKQQIMELRDLPENRICADCSCVGTVWTSVNLGIFLCMTCGAHHRSLGTHISIPKGCTGTYWWGPDEIAHMKSMGNTRASQVYGKSVPLNGVSKDGDAQAWKQFLMDKYVHRKYAEQQQETPSSPSMFHASPGLSSPGLSGSKRMMSKHQLPKNSMPDIDITHFEKNVEPPQAASPALVTPVQKKTLSTPATGDAFFGQFGL